MLAEAVAKRGAYRNCHTFSRHIVEKLLQCLTELLVPES